MAQLKDLIVNGDSKFLGDAILDHNPTADMEAATKAYVDNAIDGLPAPMQFKGSLGTGGTITSLPTASAANAGFTYKVITEGTYVTGETAKVGDMYISNGASWVLIPSGDDASGTVTSVGITNGGGLSVSGGPITTSGNITVSHADTSSQASVNNSGLTFIQDVSLDTYGHVTELGSKEITKTDITGLGIPGSDTNTTYELSGALSNHTFTSTLTAGGSGSGTSTSALTLAAGGNVSLTDDTATKKITIAAANTTYTFANGTGGFTVTPSGGNAQTVTVAHPDTSSQASVSNSGRTYIQSITLDDMGHVTGLSSATETVTIPTNNITGSGTSGSLAKFSGTNTLTDGPAFNTSATAGKYLSETGSWTRPLNGIFKGTCETPAATTTKAVTCPEFTSADLVAGAIVFVTFTITNSGAVASLNLDVNSTGAKRLKYMRNAAESDLPGVGYLRAGMTYRFVYTGSVWVCDTDYDANTYLDVPRVRNLTVDSSAGSLYRYELCMFTGDNTIMPYNKTSNAPTTYTKAVNTLSFDPFRGLVYYNTTTTVSAGAARADNNFCLVAPFDCRYSFNINSAGTAGSTSLTTSLPVYIKAKYNIASKTATLTQNVSSSNYLERSGIVQVLPTTDPNTSLDTSVEFYIYIFVGIAYSLYQICLFPENRVYAWNASRNAIKEFDVRGFVGASNSVTIGNAEYLLTRKPLTITDDGGTTTTYYIAELTAIQ